MPSLIVSPRAEEDLEEIWTFVAGRNIEAADRVITRITSRFDHLVDYPWAGRVRHDLLLNLRSFPVQGYLIFYQPTDDGIEIFRVLHGSRDIGEAFDEMVNETE